MTQQEIDLRTTTEAPPGAVYAALRDGATWPRSSDLESFALESIGLNEAEGIGAVRVWRPGRYTFRQEIVEIVPTA